MSFGRSIHVRACGGGGKGLLSVATSSLVDSYL